MSCSRDIIYYYSYLIPLSTHADTRPPDPREEVRFGVGVAYVPLVFIGALVALTGFAVAS